MQEKVAITGISCLFPGAHSPAELWTLLCDGRSVIGPPTEHQTGIDPQTYFHPEKGKEDQCYFMDGGYIDSFQFDAAGFQLPPSQLQQLDDAFQWTLYTAREALRDSGTLSKQKLLQRCGLVLGNLSFPTKQSQHLIGDLYRQTAQQAAAELLDQPNLTFPSLPTKHNISAENSWAAGGPAAITAQALGLGGLHFTLDAACASSLYALKFACDQLLAHEADLMLAGAVNGADPIFLHLGFSAIQAYEADQANRPFDKNSTGLAVSEGAAMVVLKRHSDAVRDGDHIYGLISGIGLANDGHGKFLLSPRSRGQEKAFLRAYESANLDPRQIDYIECHATGTPLGDRTELATLDRFFGHYQTVPLIGSVKSNLGHLLTGSGMAGLLKILLSMQHGEIPATINISEPATSPNNVFGGEQIVQSQTPWPQKGACKRAALSAFGFGGVDAHLIVEEAGPASEAAPATTPIPTPVKLAITGMDAHFGSADSLAELEQTIYQGKTDFRPLADNRWSTYQHQINKDAQRPLGAFVDQFSFDFLDYRIPPNEERPIPQQLLLLKTADKALQDAGVKVGSRTAVVVAMETDGMLHQLRGRADLQWQLQSALENADLSLPEAELTALIDLIKRGTAPAPQLNRVLSLIGNLMAGRIAARWDFSAPAFTISADDNAFYKAMHTARLLLTNNEADTVLLAAVDFCGTPENLLWQTKTAAPNHGTAPLSMPLDCNGSSLPLGEGAGAIILERLDEALLSDKPIYAAIEGISLVQKTPSIPNPLTVAGQNLFAATGIQPDAISYIELGLPKDQEAAELTTLQTIYPTAANHLTCAVGSIKSNIGHTRAASGIAALIKTALCLHQRYIPAIPNWQAPAEQFQPLLKETPFYFPADTRPWFTSETQPTRIAAISNIGTDGCAAQLLLSEIEETSRPRRNLYLCKTPPHLLPIAGATESDLLASLQQLQADLVTERSMCRLSARWGEQFAHQSAAQYTLSLVFTDEAALQKEIHLATAALPGCFAKNKEWKTPQGSFFTPTPLGKEGKIAFVYPGGFNSYVGLGQDLFHLCPDLMEELGVSELPVGQIIGDETIYPRSVTKLSDKEIQQRNLALAQNPITMLESGVTYSRMTTKLLTSFFGITPDIACGYSLGETSMLFALGGWKINADRSRRLRNSPLFKSRLAGAQEAVREAWDIDKPLDPNNPVWQIFVLRTSTAKLEPLLAAEPRVFLTLINSHRELVIAGDPDGCQRIIAQLKCAAFAAPYNYVIHCPPMESEWEDLVQLNHLPLQFKSVPAFYFGAANGPIEWDSKTVAETIASGICQQLDYPRLINKLYEDGARIFIELGAGGTCARWIRDSLKTKAHAALTIDRRGNNGRAGLIMLLAQLASHRIPLNLSRLYEAGLKAENLATAPSQIIVGGPNLHEMLNTPENQSRFRHALQQKSAAETGKSSLLNTLNQTNQQHIDFLQRQEDHLRQLLRELTNETSTPQAESAITIQTDGTIER